MEFNYDENTFRRKGNLFLPKQKWEVRSAKKVEEITNSIPLILDKLLASIFSVPAEYVTRMRTDTPRRFVELQRSNEGKFYSGAYQVRRVVLSGEKFQVNYENSDIRDHSINWALTNKVIFSGLNANSFYSVEDNRENLAIVQPLIWGK